MLALRRLGVRRKDDAGLRVDEAADQPGTGEAIDARPRPRHPGARTVGGGLQHGSCGGRGFGHGLSRSAGERGHRVGGRRGVAGAEKVDGLEMGESIGELADGARRDLWCASSDWPRQRLRIACERRVLGRSRLTELRGQVGGGARIHGVGA